jgi:uncharacterized protein YjbJ (UPF0337 family)
MRRPTEGTMNNRSEKTEGAAEKLGGKLKKGIGRILGSPRVRAEGQAAEARGRNRVASAKSRERAKGRAEQLLGAAKKRVGRVLGSQKMITGGKAKELVGEARQKANR